MDYNIVIRPFLRDFESLVGCIRASVIPVLVKVSTLPNPRPTHRSQSQSAYTGSILTVLYCCPTVTLHTSSTLSPSVTWHSGNNTG